MTHTQSLGVTPLDEGTAPSQMPAADNTQYSQDTDMPPAGIRTRNSSKRTAADPRFGPPGNRDLCRPLCCWNYIYDPSRRQNVHNR